MRHHRGKVLRVDITPYHILDVMADPAYMPHFIRRFNIGMDMAIARGRMRPFWSYHYENNPKLLYDDCVDEIKRLLGQQEASASSTRIVGMVRDIVLDAASDWITEKTGRTPEFELFPNTVKSAKTNFKYYVHNKKEQKAREAGAPGTTLDLGHPGTSAVREEPSGGDEFDELF